MKKGYILSTLASGVAGAYLGKRKNNNNLSNLRGQMDPMEADTIMNNAGVPGEIDDEDMAQFENAKMVSEGSRYGVHYYNQYQDEENE